MKLLNTTFLIIFLCNILYSQKNSFSLELNYGLAGNHFVRSYGDDLNKKDFLGTISQIQVNYVLKNNTMLSLGYARDSHQQEKSFEDQNVKVENFSLRHNNNFYYGSHTRKIHNNFKYHLGLFYMRPEQQEILVLNNFVWIKERDNPNNRLNEGGLLGGVSWEKQLDTKLKGGLKLTGYYIASASTYETTTLTSYISYTLN